MTDTEIILNLIDLHEGGFVNDPDDAGGPKKFGITARTLGHWRRLGRPATAEEVAALEKWEAVDILREKFVFEPGFLESKVFNEPLRLQLIDFGINSGPARAIRWLQRVIHVPVTGKMDRATVEWLFRHRGYGWLVNDALAAARLKMLDLATDQGDVAKRFEEGLESRAMSFILTSV